MAGLPRALGRASWGRGEFRGKTVVHIQDIHLNAEAQGNIRDAVAALLPHVDVVALEGEWSPLALDGIRSEDPNALRRVADRFVESLRLEGPLHAVLTSSRRVAVEGVDDADLHDANVAAYRAAIGSKAAAMEALAKRRRTLQRRKAAVFSPALLALDAAMDDYHAGRISMGQYLAALQPITPTGSGTIGRFLDVLRIEKSLDLDRVSSERRRLVAELADRLTPAETEELVRTGEALRSGNGEVAGFYSGLMRLCESRGIRMAQYPAMRAYATYVQAAERIDPAALQTEISAAERAAVASLARTDEERLVADESRRQRLTSKLLEFSLSSDEWSALSSADLPAGFAPYADFYRKASARDRAMASRLDEILSRPGVTNVLLVTGGFHAAPLNRQLEASRVEVVTWTPRLTRIDQEHGSRALEIFLQEKTPLDAMFEGNRLFLSPRPTRNLPAMAAALVALTEPAGDATRSYLRMVPGAAVTSVRVSHGRPGESSVVLRSGSGSATVSVEASRDGGLTVDVSGAPAALAVLDSTRRIGRRLGLTIEQIAVDLAPRRELLQTLTDYLLFLIVGTLTLGLVRPNYFLNLHGDAVARDLRFVDAELRAFFPNRPDLRQSFREAYQAAARSPGAESAAAVQPSPDIPAGTRRLVKSLLGGSPSVVVEIGGGSRSAFLRPFIASLRDDGEPHRPEVYQLEVGELLRLDVDDGSPESWTTTRLETAPLDREHLKVNPTPAWHYARHPAVAARANLVVANAPVLRASFGRSMIDEISTVAAPGAVVLLRLHEEDVFVMRLSRTLGHLREQGFVLERMITSLPSDFPGTDYLARNPAPLLVFRRVAPSLSQDERMVGDLVRIASATRSPYAFLEALSALEFYRSPQAGAALPAIRANMNRLGLRDEESRMAGDAMRIIGGELLTAITPEDPRLPEVMAAVGRAIADLHSAGLAIGAANLEQSIRAARVFRQPDGYRVRVGGEQPMERFRDDRRDRSRGIARIRLWSTAAIALSAGAIGLIETVIGSALSAHGALAAIVLHAAIAAIVTLPVLSMAQVQAHRLHNRWAMANGRAALALNLDDPRERRAEGITEVKIEIEGKTYSVFGIGHGTKSRKAFDSRLKKLGVTTVVDVRQVPYSSRFPQFKREALAKSLKKKGIRYLWFGVSLGGRDNFPAYIQLDPGSSYSQGIERLVEVVKKSPGPVCLLGAATNPFFCHRDLILRDLSKRFPVSPPRPVESPKPAAPRQIQLTLFDDEPAERGPSTAALPSTLEFGARRGLSPDETALRVAPVRELAHTLLDFLLFVPTFVLTLGFSPSNYFLNLHDNRTLGERADRARGIASIRLWSTAAVVISIGLIALVEILAGSSLPVRGPIATILVHAALSAGISVPALSLAQVLSHRRYNRWALANRRATLELGNDRSRIGGLEHDEEQLVAAAAYAFNHRVDGIVPGEVIEKCRSILFGDEPTPEDMWQAAYDFLQFSSESGYAAFLVNLKKAVDERDTDLGMLLLEAKNGLSVISRLKGPSRQQAVAAAAAVVIDERDPRPVIPETLTADHIAVFQATKGNFDTKDGLPKDVNEDFGLHFILPDGTIIMFTADGMGGYGHGDQAAKLAAAAYFRVLLDYWNANRGNPSALTDVLRLEREFNQAMDVAQDMVDRNLKNTLAGAVFDVLWARPNPDGSGWFYVNYHRGDTRTEVGIPGKPLQTASIDNDASEAVTSLAALQHRIRDEWAFRFLRSAASHADVAGAVLAKIFKTRNLVVGPLIEGNIDNGYGVTYGTLPVGSFILQNTDGRLDPLTEAAAGNVVAASVSLSEVPYNLVEASQPNRAPDETHKAVFREKGDDVFVHLAALGPISALEKGTEEEERAIEEAVSQARLALVAVEEDNREEARAASDRATAIMARVADRSRGRIDAAHGLVRAVAEIVVSIEPYFVVGERLTGPDGEIGYVVDDGHLVPGHVATMKDSSTDADGPYHADLATVFNLHSHAELAGKIGKTVHRLPPGMDYFEQRKMIASFGFMLKGAIKRGVEFRDGLSVADIKSQIVSQNMPNGAGVQLEWHSALVLDNGSGPDALVPGIVILYYDKIDEIGVMTHSDFFEKQINGKVEYPAELYEAGRGKLREAFSKAGGLTLEAQQERFVGLIDGQAWDELGLGREEMEARKTAGKALVDQLFSSAETGDEVLMYGERLLVIDNGRNAFLVGADDILVYRYPVGGLHAWLMSLPRTYFSDKTVTEIRRASAENVVRAEAARDFIRRLVSQPDRSITADVDELPWNEVLPESIPEPTAMATRGTRAVARSVFGWSSPDDELKIRLLALVTELASSSVPVLHVLLHENRGREWIDRFVKHGIILAATWLVPAIFIGAVTPAAVALAAGGNVVSHFLVSVLPLLVHRRAASRAPGQRDVSALIDAAIPEPALLGAAGYNPEKLRLIGLTDAQVDNIAARAAAASTGARIPWNLVQDELVRRLDGDRTGLPARDEGRLALALEGGSPSRRRSDAAFVERVLNESPAKDLVIFFNGRDAGDRAAFGALAARSGGRIRLVGGAEALIRSGRAGRVLDLGALERALESNRGAWEGAAFLIPPGLSFDAAGVGQESVLRELVFLFLDRSLRSLEAGLRDLQNIDRIARVISRQA